MRRSWRLASWGEWAVLALLAAWGVFPVVLLLVHAVGAHARFTGADGLIGADGVLGADQLQYLAWTREAGAHGLISDLFSLAPSGRVYLQPLFFVSGMLWRLGLSLPVAYLLWKPVATVVLFAASVAWARRMFGERLGARVAVVVLSLFLYAPVTELVTWAGTGSGSFRFEMYSLGYELLAANKLWGYVPSALALALVPIALLALERALGRAPAGLWSARGPLVVASGASLLASWLHPWQGVTLLVIFAGLAVWQRLGGWRMLLFPAGGAVAPLVYYFVLSRTDPAWRLASRYEVVARWPAVVLLAGLGPLLLIAAIGIRRPRGVIIERVLWLWIPACLITYFSVNSFAPHALQGISFPFAVLAVRGWQRLRLPAALGALAIAAITLPGLAYDARKFVDVTRSSAPQYYLTSSDARALDWVAEKAPPGGVLAPTPFAAVVPSQTGRAVWVGHGDWSQDYSAQARATDSLFGGRMHPARARAFVLSTGATLLVSDCSHHANLSRTLRGVVRAVKRFGCARVYVVRRP
jgi:hypothetical protein